MSKNKFSADFVAGVVGGSCGLLAGQPFDVVKVRLQTSSMYNGINDCVRQILKTEGVMSFYRGIVPPLLGVGALNAVLFGTYAGTKRLLLHGNQGELTPKQHFICGAVAGLACCTVTVPTELIKCREQIFMTPEQTKSGTSTMSCIRQIVKTSGYRGLFTGFWITAWRDVPGYGIYFATYEFVKHSWIDENAPMDLKAYTKLCVAGAVAGIVGWLPPVYQVDMIKSRMQTQSLDKPIYKSSMDCLKQMVKAEGYQVLTRGLGSAMLRAVPVNAVTFAVYEAALIALKNRH